MNHIIEVAAPVLAPIFAKNQDRVLSLRFEKALGRKRQDPPKSFYDKVFWMSAHTDTSLWTRLADKIEVRKFVKERCGEDILPKLYAIYESADNIDFGALPDSFAIKTNNGCASNYLVRSKADADLEAIRSGLARWLRFPYGQLTGQLHYAKIVPRILAEELLFQEEDPDTTLVDYKFYCFDGEPRYCYVVSDRQFDSKHTHSRMMYDMNWNPLSEVFVSGKELCCLSEPVCFGEMQEISATLSGDIPFVRIDLYAVNNVTRFGEMTFMPGMDPGFTERFQEEMGGMLVLPKGIVS